MRLLAIHVNVTVIDSALTRTHALCQTSAAFTMSEGWTVLEWNENLTNLTKRSECALRKSIRRSRFGTGRAFLSDNISITCAPIPFFIERGEFDRTVKPARFANAEPPGMEVVFDHSICTRETVSKRQVGQE